MDPVSKVYGLDLDCLPMLNIDSQLAYTIVLHWKVNMIYALSWDQRLKKYVDLK